VRRSVSNRRLEDRIRDLCKELTHSEDGNFEIRIAELRKALAEHALRVHNKTAATVLGWPEFPHDRRKP